jgi:hypothetical protein
MAARGVRLRSIEARKTFLLLRAALYDRAMTEIELIFPCEFDEEIVREQLSQSDSGFTLEEGRGLRSAVVDGFSIAGTVVSALSLGTALVSLKAQLAQNARNSKTSEPEIRIRRIYQSNVRVLPTGETEKAVQVIEEISAPKR